MWILILEAVVALALLLGIVWWSWPKRRKPTDEEQQDTVDRD